MKIRSRPRLRPRPAALGAAALALGLSLGVSGCGDDPFQINWESAPDTTLLYSLARPELNLPSAFSFNRRQPLRVETPGSSGAWDVAVDTEDSQLVLLPPGALGINSRARIRPLPGKDFGEVVEAPSDTTGWVSSASVPLSLGTVYVVQTGETLCSFGRRGVRYAKLEPLVIDVEGGTVEFQYDTNPVCNDPRLVPPDGD